MLHFFSAKNLKVLAVFLCPFAMVWLSLKNALARKGLINITPF